MANADRSRAPTPGFQLPRGLRHFLRTEQGGAMVLLAAAVLALVWANSPWRASYDSLWSIDAEARLGGLAIHADLRHLVNEALMALFFFVVGLEIKRELVAGELRSWRRAALPVVAAVGGMVVPALLYTVLNAGRAGSAGWGVPMATDIAFAIGAVALLGSRVPSSLKIFLLSLAIVDDIGAILVIAVFYTESIRFDALAVAAVLIVAIVALRRAGVVWVPAYAAVGTGVWLAVFQSGVHPTIAGALLGLMTPAHSLGPAVVAREWSADLSDEPDPAELRAMTGLARSTVSVAERLQYALHPLVSFAVLPLFALANAGVALDGDVFSAPGASRVVLGVILGLVVGKAIGITGFSWLAVRFRLGALPDDIRWAQVLGMALTAGIGFTVSLFIAELAFKGGQLAEAAKVAILMASVLAAIGGLLVLRRTGRPTSPEEQVVLQNAD